MNRRDRLMLEAQERKRKVKAQQKVRLALAQRNCGDCTECCTTLAVDALKKPADQTCEYVCNTGCSIYATRPRVCQAWNCLWRQGLGHKNERPDQTGLLFELLGKQIAGMTPLVVKEVREGAFEASRPILDRLASEGHVLHLKGDKPQLLGPPEKVKHLRETLTRV